MEKIKAVVTGAFAALSSFLGILAVPVYVLVVLNIADYGTGLVAAKYRGEKISSAQGFRGIAKKVCMWLLIGLGSAVDWLLMFAAEQVHLDLHFSYFIGCFVAIWLICNEILSILENVGDIGVPLPGFLKKIVEHLKGTVEEKGEE